MQSNSIGIPLPGEQVPDWLLALRNGFLASLVLLGLKITTIKHYAPHSRLVLCRGGTSRADGAGRR